jgi:hypothetical protein
LSIDDEEKKFFFQTQTVSAENLLFFVTEEKPIKLEPLALTGLSSQIYYLRVGVQPT